MKHDLRKSAPDLATVLEESSPDRVRERRRKALAKLVDAGLVAESTPPPAPDEARPVTKPTGTAARQWPRSWKLVLGFALVALGAPALSVLLGRAGEPKGMATASATAAAVPEVLPSPAPPPSTAATTTPSATATATAAPTAEPSTKPTAPPVEQPPPPRRPKPKPKTETVTQAPPEPPPLSPKFAE
jgi:hypothetical protein